MRELDERNDFPGLLKQYVDNCQQRPHNSRQLKSALIRISRCCYHNFGRIALRWDTFEISVANKLLLMMDLTKVSYLDRDFTYDYVFQGHSIILCVNTCLLSGHPKFVQFQRLSDTFNITGCGRMNGTKFNLKFRITDYLQ